VSCDPQFSQKTEPTIFECRQLGQIISAEPESVTCWVGGKGGAAAALTVRRSYPQLSQKIAPAGAAIWQLGQVIDDIERPPCSLKKTEIYMIAGLIK
jgi:hypothetical protein